MREKILNFGNGITEILVDWETNCGNAIVEIGKKKFCGNCGNAIAENGRKKKIVVVEITCEELKKKVLCLQYFHNKSQVISYY